jgi:hypothetical protein
MADISKNGGLPSVARTTNGEPAATVDGNAQSTVAKDDIWDEEKIEHSLETLDEMFIQVCSIRANQPRCSV